MDNIDDTTFRRMIDELGTLSGAMSKLTKSMHHRGTDWDRFNKYNEDQAKSAREKAAWEKKQRDNDPAAFHNRFNKSASNVAASLKLLGGGVDGVTNVFKDFSKRILGGAIGGTLIGGLTDYIGGLTGTYRDLADVGQVFSGGLVGMTRAAAESGNSFDEYSRIMKRNSATIAQMGGSDGKGSFGMLAKSVREATYQHGMHGYTIEQLNDLTADYMTTLGLSTKLTDVSNEKASKSVVTLAKNTSDLAATFGKSRGEIEKATRQILTSTTFTTYLAEMDAKKRAGVLDKMTMAVSGIVASLGPSGNLLAKMLADSAGMDGNVHLTEGAQIFAKAGMVDVADKIAKFNQQLEGMKDANPEDIFKAQFKFTEDVIKGIEPHLNMLKVLANAGNAEAKQVLEMYNNRSKLTLEEAEAEFKKNKATDEFTTGIMNFTNKMNGLFGEIKTPLLKALGAGLESAAKAFNNENVQAALIKMRDTVVKVSQAIGSMIFKVFGGDEAKNAEENIIGIAKGLTEWAENISKSLKDGKTLGELVGGFLKEAMVGAIKFLFSSIAGALIGAVTGAVVSVFTTPSKSLVDVIIGITAAFILFKATMLGVNAVMGAYKAAKGIGEMVTGKGGSGSNVAAMNVNARIVNVYGKNGLGADGGGDGPDKRGPRKGGRIKNALRAAKGFGVLGSVIGAGMLYNNIGDINERKEKGELTAEEASDEKTKAYSSAAGSAIGAAAGAAIGSIVPVFGTIIGGAVGGWLGEKAGGMVGDYINDKAKVKPNAATPTGNAAEYSDRLNRTGAVAGASVTAATAVAPNISTPRENRNIDQMQEEIRKKEAELEKQQKNEANVISLSLIKEVQLLQEAVKEQTALLVKQNKDQTDILKEQRNKLTALDKSS